MPAEILYRYRFIKLHLKLNIKKFTKTEVGQKISGKRWKNDIAPVPDWPREKFVATF